MRKLQITRVKKIGGGAAKAYIYVDGKNQGCIDNGKTGVLEIDCNAHSLYIVITLPQGDIKSNMVTIPSNDLNYWYHFELKTGLFSSTVSLFEDEKLAEQNRQTLIDRKQFNDIKSKVDSVFDKIISGNEIGKRDYGLLKTLPDYCRESDYYKRNVLGMRYNHYKNCAEMYFDDKIGINVIYLFMLDAASLCGKDKNTFTSLKHYNYLITQNNIINSCLSENISESLESIRKKNMRELSESILSAYNQGLEFYKQGKYENAINSILLTDFSAEDLNDLKKWMIWGSMIEGESKETSDFYNTLQNVNCKLMKIITKKDGKILQLKNIDMIIAESIRLANARSISNINDELETFLNITCKIFNVKEQQYRILQNLFSYLNAYEQEKMVLEAMVSNCIPRTSEQEERLSFLKTHNPTSFDNSSTADSASNTESCSDGKFTYEYRSVSWNNKEISEYFDSLSLQNQTVQTPFVIEEWNKNLNINNITWDIEKVAEKIEDALKENFGDRYKVGLTNSRSTGGISEYDKTILITDFSENGYPWLTFNVIGEQITKNQIMIYVYAMYMTNFDLSLSNSIIERNKEICNKILLLKQKQNPKINSYMQVLTDIIIKELENWLNGQNSSSIYD